jgi:phage/plasmid-associated DNA primase
MTMTQPARAKPGIYGDQQAINIVAEFVEKGCRRDEAVETDWSELYAGFLRWCKRAGRRQLSRNMFASRFTQFGFSRRTSKSRTFIIGVEPVDARK